MAWTTPRTWVSGELVTGSICNTHIRDNFNALHDVGAWTPTIAFGGGSTGVTYSTRPARYSKAGRFVFAQGRITLSSKGSSTGQASVGGLPYTVENVSGSFNGSFVVSYFAGMTTNLITFGGIPQNNTTVVPLYGLGAASTGLAQILDTDFANASDFIFSAIYMASTD